ncbi:hypothetical protein L211DRAFT_791593 [Terfezia boudieri ATCC MYA-4762]|uniref:N1221-domain-containing protein n=1 Tax=Terfezia boudieri ATCC MYA-4762 TaxID=1051890 RepID=A0A3N4LJE7_9PEZI|nr:hypothetical protein L211DRAFT_791593 [Terfezia boudieri ATCC MYA-4762]
MNVNSLALRIDTGPIHQQQPLNNAADTGPLTTQDSLSLGQLKKLVSEGVKAKAPEYAFAYTDTDILPNELNDFFSYDRAEMDLILAAREEFNTQWKEFCMGTKISGKKSRPKIGAEVMRWRDADPERRQKFVVRFVDSLETIDQGKRVRALEVLSYIVQGVFGEATSEHDQLYWVVENSKLLQKCVAIDTVYQVFRGIMDKIYLPEHPPSDQQLLDLKELRHSILILYFILTVYIPSALMDPTSHRKPSPPSSFLSSPSFRRPPLYSAPTTAECDALRDEIADLDPLFIPWLIKTISQIRWQDDEKQKDQIPLQQLLLLTWKGILVGIGSIKNPKHLSKAKSYARVKEGLSKRVDKKLITASPLDYHNFRQDILAKYPAYNPPPAVNGFEIERLSPYDGLSGTHCTAGANGILGGTTSSILNQPVHIATPAPSPPPSPVGGKGAKKQNYQTNQNFPFLYPPPNSSASSIWGRVEVGQMDATSVPESILEAGDLFQRRIRMTLAMRQLWKEREEFLRHERGWAGGLGLGDEPISNPKSKVGQNEKFGSQICMEERRLRTVEDLYTNCLSNLQSFIIVCLKVVLQNLCTPTAPPAPHPPPTDDQASSGDNGETGVTAGAQPTDDTKWNMMRETEIMSKAVSAIFLLLLKWFRVSHVLKFEYMTQLLLDTSYLPLMLRIFSHQDVGTHVNTKTDRSEYSYLHYCKVNSAAPEPDDNEIFKHQEEEDLDLDDAIPPPIKMRRDTLPPPAPPPNKPPPLPPTSPSQASPQSKKAPTIITDYSWRNFFTVVNYLRIMQKICKGKAHRNLLLVQYKSSPSLRKALKCSQDDMRLYTLKLFKGQVPYCGRKWRQGNMKVITGIYLHCRPELRDDWLAGADVDAEVEDALPQEHAIRALTNFYNIQRYPMSMGADEDMLNEEKDFFVRELERMHVLGIGGIAGQGLGEFVGEGSGQGGIAGSMVQGNGAGSGPGSGAGDREVESNVGSTWEALGEQWGEMPPI